MGFDFKHSGEKVSQLMKVENNHLAAILFFLDQH